MSSVLYVLAQANNLGPADKSGRNIFEMIQPWLMWGLIGYFAALALSKMGGRDVSRLAVIIGLCLFAAIPILSPNGFLNILKSWADGATSGFGG